MGPTSLQYSSQKNACPALPDVVCKQKSIMAAAFFRLFKNAYSPSPRERHHFGKNTIPLPLLKVLTPYFFSHYFGVNSHELSAPLIICLTDKYFKNLDTF